MRQPSQSRLILTHVGLVVFTALTLYPVLWVFRLALESDAGLGGGLLPIPRDVTLDNFRNVLGTTDSHGWLFGKQLFNSIFVPPADPMEVRPPIVDLVIEDYRRLRAILAGDGRHRGDRVLAYVFFTEPQVGRVGLTAAQARERGHQIREATVPLTHVARARLTGHTRGFYRMVVDAESDKILGATLVGPQAGEVAQILLAHMEAGSTWQVVERTTHVHPSYAEGLPTLARQFC